MKDLKNRYRYSIILLKQLVKTDFKLRYQGSTLGYLWSLLRPLLLFGILYVVFVKFLKVGKGIPFYPVYLLLGIVMWNYFAEVTGAGVSAIVGRGDLMRKINFPRYVVVLAGSFGALINLFLNFIVVALFMFINHVPLRATALLLPLIILELFVFSLAVAFFLSTAFVRFRDFSYIWEVSMQALFYLTPILYPLSQIPVRYAKILILSPPAQIIQDARWALVTGKTATIGTVYHHEAARLVCIGITVITVIIAVAYFRNRSRYFAENV